MTTGQQTLEPILVSVSDAARLLGLSRTLFYQGLANGRIGPVGVRFNSKRLFAVDELRAWTAAGCPSRERWIRDKQCL